MNIRAVPSKTSAFTLIELVISSAVAAMILVGAYMCLSAGIAGQKLIEPRSEVTQSARVAMAILSADLHSACPMSKEFDFLGMDRMMDEVEADNLDFATHNYAPKRPGEGDFCQISYFLEKDEDGRLNLWRRRNPMMALDPLEGGAREEIARDLLGMRFEYYDGFDWYDDWGNLETKTTTKEPSEEEPNLTGMPEAVRVTLMFDPNPKRTKAPDASTVASTEPPLVFQTVVRLELAASSQTDESAGGGANASEGEAN